jgi:hypothetical protein
VIPDQGLRLVRRRARWSTAQRRVLAVVLCAPALLVAFPPVRDAAKVWLFFTFGMACWLSSIGRLLIAWDRITGMWHVRRELWLRRADDSPTAWIAVLDGREVRARSAGVVLAQSVIDHEGGRAGPATPIWTVALRLDENLYEIERTPLHESGVALARVLAHEVHGDASKILQPHIGREMWRLEYHSALDAAFVPGLAKAIGFTILLLPANDLRFALVGALAIAVRVALVLDRLVNATARQLDRKFAKDFGGARPARPIRGLRPNVVRRALFWSRLLMYVAAVSVMLRLKP